VSRETGRKGEYTMKNTCAYDLDRAMTRAFLALSRTAPFTPEEAEARAELDRRIKDLDEYGAAWKAAQALKEARA